MAVYIIREYEMEGHDPRFHVKSAMTLRWWKISEVVIVDVGDRRNKPGVNLHRSLHHYLLVHLSISLGKGRAVHGNSLDFRGLSA